MNDYQVVVIGGGPGGYVAAIRAAQLGLKTSLIEKDIVGGLCLNWGCIPSKALLRNAEVLNLIKNSKEFGIHIDNFSPDFSEAVKRSRKVVKKLTSGVGFLLKKNKVELISDTATINNSNEIKLQNSDKIITADNIILATGSNFREFPNMPVDEKRVITSRQALELNDVPKKIAIVGGGATGIEFSYIFNAYGSDVTIIELADRILNKEDLDVSKELTKLYEKKGINILPNTQINNLEVSDKSVLANLSVDGEESSMEFDILMVAVGAEANTNNLGLENVGIELDNGWIKIDEYMNTNISNIYAIGDVTGKLLQAHVASHQGVVAVEKIAGLNPEPIKNYLDMPRAIYCEPQVASIGLTEEEAKEQGYKIKTGTFPLAASGKALGLGDTEGFSKLIFDSEIGELLGAHLIGSNVSELLGEIGILKLLEGSSKEIGDLVHPHPTISEVLKESALGSLGSAIHI
ncbi:MAG: dihydrolipoyl dehydrogenase [Dehalococcoidia bacterium]